MIFVDDLSENVAILLQHDCDLDVSVHVHVRGVAHGFGLQTQGDCRRMVGVDGQVLQIRYRAELQRRFFKNLGGQWIYYKVRIQYQAAHPKLRSLYITGGKLAC